jgi:sodium/potassium-transporting ATPase subunit alpha
MAMGFTLSILVLFIFIPFFQDVFHTRDVRVEYWFIRMSDLQLWLIIALGFGAGLLLMDELRKFLVRRYPKGIIARMAW